MPQHETLAAALAAFQAELPKLTKDQTGEVKGQTDDGRRYSYNYGYADLAQVTEEVSPALGNHGLSFTAEPTINDKGVFVLAYSLLHEKGETRDGTWPLPDPLRTKPQQVGSAITYARRYAFMAVTNTFPGGEDDDGAAAVPAGHRDQAMSPEQFDNLPRERPGAQQARQASEPVRGEAGAPQPPAQPKKDWSKATDDDVSELHGRLEKLDVEQAVKLYDWMAKANLHKRQIPIAVEGQSDEEPLTADASEVLAYRLSELAVKPDVTLRGLAFIRTYAEDRGLLKIQVSETETLDQVVAGARELVAKAATDTPEARQKRDDAAHSWDDNGTPAIPGSV